MDRTTDHVDQAADQPGHLVLVHPHWVGWLVMRVATAVADAKRNAQGLEAQAEDYPDERGEILIEAAEAWRRADQHDRAIRLLSQVVDVGGEDGASARVAMADLLFELDRGDDAHTQLAVLRREPCSSPVPYHCAAELLEERNELQDALTWFNMAVARLTDNEIADLRAEPFSYAFGVVAGRRRVRQAL